MGKFYLDLEFTNGNYYLADIIEVALVSDSGCIFQRYVKLNYTLPGRVTSFTGITDNTLRVHGIPFRDVINDMVKFVNKLEQEPVIVAHNGYFSDFPILLTNCMKHGVNVSLLDGYKFIDSMQIIKKNTGVHSPGLASLGQTVVQHSALEDAKLLKMVCTRYDIPSSQYSLSDLLCHMKLKLPISIDEIRHIAATSSRYEIFLDRIWSYARRKTALRPEQVEKVAIYYYRNHQSFDV